ncbi:hypothetical protein BGW38_002096 [Lunasporangiospora selenospora]|uniref:RING-type domain-containing protein n=1 Tax=Lunasporangiospora selenospora TaxID=979761 RepID=A0A9P6FT24_9FUNG|nr:hypothetical protein BGW38_002096 [Lunasporangiospora selenospora]
MLATAESKQKHKKNHDGGQSCKGGSKDEQTAEHKNKDKSVKKKKDKKKDKKKNKNKDKTDKAEKDDNSKATSADNQIKDEKPGAKVEHKKDQSQLTTQQAVTLSSSQELTKAFQNTALKSSTPNQALGAKASGSGTSHFTHPSMQNLASDDMALSMMIEKESKSEVEQLQDEVERLQRELESRDKIIAQLKEKLLSISSRSGNQGSLSDILAICKVEGPLHGAISKASLQCSICVDFFASPFTIECGHTFCYTCLHSWLEIHKSCPTCRMKLLRRPTLSFTIRDQVQSYVTEMIEPDRSAVQKRLSEEDEHMKRLQIRQEDLWKGVFKPFNFAEYGGSVMDDEDGVRRCVSCGWEVSGGACVNCSTLYSDAEESDNSQNNSDAESEPDAYDSHDSFINDDDDLGVDTSDDARGSSSSDENQEDGNPTRHGRGYVRTRAGRSEAKRARKNFQAIVLDSDDSSQSEAEEVGSSDQEESDAEESEKSEKSEVSEMSEDSDAMADIRPTRQRRKIFARRAITITDDEDVDESNETNPTARDSEELKDEGGDETNAKQKKRRRHGKSPDAVKNDIGDSSSSNSEDDFMPTPKRNNRTGHSNLAALFA